MLSVMRDITDRKLADERLRASEARYRALFECAPDGIIISDTENRYLDANTSACRMLGYTRAELIRLGAADILAPMEIPRLESAVNQIKAKSDYRQEWRLRRKDGTFRFRVPHPSARWRDALDVGAWQCPHRCEGPAGANARHGERYHGAQGGGGGGETKRRAIPHDGGFYPPTRVDRLGRWLHRLV